MYFERYAIFNWGFELSLFDHPARACFLEKMINLIMKASETQKLLSISEVTKEDMRMWLTFLNYFNGKWIFLNELLGLAQL